MIDIAKLKELVALMSSNDLAEVSIKHADDSIVIKRGQQAQTIINHQPVMYGAAGAPAAVHAPMPAAPAAPATQAAAPAAAPAPAKAPAGPSIDSPMVGTFYSRPNPDAKAFVTPGQSVSADSVVCIIEAMKVFNEIKAEKSGVIEQVLVKNGEAVEFGQKLFLVRPS